MRERGEGDRCRGRIEREDKRNEALERSVIEKEIMKRGSENGRTREWRERMRENDQGRERGIEKERGSWWSERIE